MWAALGAALTLTGGEATASGDAHALSASGEGTRVQATRCSFEGDKDPALLLKDKAFGRITRCCLVGGYSGLNPA